MWTYIGSVQIVGSKFGATGFVILVWVEEQEGAMVDSLHFGLGGILK